MCFAKQVQLPFYVNFEGEFEFVGWALNIRLLKVCEFPGVPRTEVLRTNVDVLLQRNGTPSTSLLLLLNPPGCCKGLDAQ